jgi:signal peptidase I
MNALSVAHAPTRVSQPVQRRSRLWIVLAMVGVGVAIALVLRTFVLATYFVPSASMEPTIQPGQHILVDKLSGGSSIHRGDVVVFDGLDSFSRSSNGDIVKRVIGVSGDHVVCCNSAGKITVNGFALDETYVLPGDVPSTVRFDVIVPEGHLWVMGDDRSDSFDSRYLLGQPGGGMVPVARVVGRVEAIAWPLSAAHRLSTPTTFAHVPASAAAPDGSTP